MSDRIETVEGLFGEKIHYKNGEKMGESWEGLFPGSFNHYDSDGNKIGHSDIGLFSDLNHYDLDGEYKGFSQRGVFGGMNHYDKDGGYRGNSFDGLFETYTDIGE